MVKKAQKEETGQDEAGGEDNANGKGKRMRLEAYQIQGLEDHFLNVEIYPSTEAKVICSLTMDDSHNHNRNN